MTTQEKMKNNKYEMDMCSGPFVKKILIFSIPLMLSGILQLLFNAADIIVVGRFAGSDSMAAVGSTSSLINLIVNVFIGLSVGTNVLAARYYGANKEKELNEVVHTAITTAIVSGVILIIVGFLVAAPALSAMGTPDNVIANATLYMRIFFVGMPAMMVYNFGSAILRAIGDTKRPLYYLFISGVLNVVVNLLFVIVFDMGVAGVALSTVLSQIVSAILVVRCLMKSEGAYQLVLKELRIVPDKLLKMIQIGVPAGLQGALFSVSNVLIQSSVNSFGSTVMAGNTAASNVEGFVYTSMNAFHQTAVSFTSQNYGARKFKTIGKIAVLCQVMVFIVGAVLGGAAFLFAREMLQVYTPKPEVIEYGVLRLSIICTSYFLCGMMDVMVGILRGMGYSVMPMLVSLTGACLFRIVWVMTVFKQVQTITCLYWSYPISWGLTFAVHLICFIIVYRKLLRKAS